MGALAWLNPAKAGKLLGSGRAGEGRPIGHHAAYAKRWPQALDDWNNGGGLGGRVARLLIIRPADLAAGEITDKGYVNQRRVLARRAALVELLRRYRSRTALSSRAGPRDPSVPACADR